MNAPERVQARGAVGAMTVTHLVVDCNDLERAAAFWSGMLGMKITNREADWVDLEPLAPAGPVLAFQLVPEAKAVKNRLHLDIEVDELAGAARRATELGASAASGVFGSTDAPWQVWRDPEGNEFCLITRGA